MKPEDVTKTWLSKVLQDSFNSKFEVLELVPLKTVGYLSTACKAKIRCGDKIEKLFLKFTLPGDDPFTAFLNKYNLDASEVKAYKEIIPKLVEFEKVRFLTQFQFS